jgi:hypothetical protein
MRGGGAQRNPREPKGWSIPRGGTCGTACANLLGICALRSWVKPRCPTPRPTFESEISRLHNTGRRSLLFTLPHIQWVTRTLSQGAMWPARVGKQSFPSRVDIRNVQGFASFIFIKLCLTKHAHNFTLMYCSQITRPRCRNV